MHEILDDWESVFYMLIWSVLHYTAHSRHNNMDLLIDLYDKIKIDWYGNVEGESDKRDMI